MKIIFGQGNPGKEYEGTRHNIGFFFIDILAKKYGGTFIKKPKFHAEIAEITIAGEKTILVKPTTFYNDTGSSAQSLIAFYKLSAATDFLVIHDDLALPFGTIRTRFSGRDAGNNGIKSLNAHIGMQHARIRVGVYTALRDRIADNDFVIGNFTAEETKLFPSLIVHVLDFVEKFVSGTFEPTKITL